MHIVDRLAPGWLVIHLFGTVVLTAVLVTAHPVGPLLWLAYGASAGCWLGFILLDRIRPRFAVAVLAASVLPAALVVGPAPDTTALVIACVLLGRLASLPAPSGRLILGLLVYAEVCAIGGCLLWHRSSAEVFGAALMLFLLTLAGLNRRQYQLQAGQAEQLLAQTRLAQQERERAAALDERTRIARELHDVLAHSLGALTVQLQVVEAVLEGDDPAGAGQALAGVRRANRLARDGLAEARDAVAALRAESVPSLPDALVLLADAHRRDHRVPVRVDTDGPVRPLSSASVVSLVRTAREALTNASKHAPGAPVEVRLVYRPDQVSLTVRDDGTGTGAAPACDGGFGLTGMRERLALVGGTLDAGPGAAGWLVTATVPG